ncbi:hypothetical protein C9I98_02930 [Photobacterium sanctipauli]|uniref:C factor cell-cell signaling protein n=1 Tax=Photobacterium sanctipauli TaxID=1342794 RepID=A0A2T3P126_9GAMM|nr:hypothetical protein [Photobacterium sanctipauli]PSW22233.1 hypothetical protein C9I98_02930 [Photobacterium sanctipauli]
MKVLIEYTEMGKYRDNVWEGATTKTKGQTQAVTPSFAAQLIENNKAKLVTTECDHIIIEN